MRSVASDNYAGVHPRVLEALAEANVGTAAAYGADTYTQAADAILKQAFGDDAEAFFVWNGTGANVLSFQAVGRSFESILCSEFAHIHVDECGAVEKHTGMKLWVCPSVEGKLTPGNLSQALHARGNQHHVQPKVLSITQPTELGTLYLPEEMAALAEFCRQNGLIFHVDGARLFNAAVALNVPLRAISTDVGVDVLSLGGTKNGLLGAEAVLFLQPERLMGASAHFPYVRKQGMQLASKMRFLSAQFLALMRDDLWHQNASQANAMAQYMVAQLQCLPLLRLDYPVAVNALFVSLPCRWVAPLQERWSFYVWKSQVPTPIQAPAQEPYCQARWMTAFDTTVEQVDDFVADLQEVIAQNPLISSVVEKGVLP
ncbi:MAG: beta-eliminating lyase-related protein [Candidatus Melainabacteria bacterium]|nr:beta-eliminating lyase-related protein [Candidatus Melainabacteria bacterium]